MICLSLWQVIIIAVYLDYSQQITKPVLFKYEAQNAVIVRLLSNKWGTIQYLDNSPSPPPNRIKMKLDWRRVGHNLNPPMKRKWMNKKAFQLNRSTNRLLTEVWSLTMSGGGGGGTRRGHYMVRAWGAQLGSLYNKWPMPSWIMTTWGALPGQGDKHGWKHYLSVNS